MLRPLLPRSSRTDLLLARFIHSAENKLIKKERKERLVPRGFPIRVLALLLSMSSLFYKNIHQLCNTLLSSRNREPLHTHTIKLHSDLLRAGQSRDRIPVGARFSTPVQTGPGAHTASCTMGTGSFPRVKRPGRGTDPPPHLAQRLKE